MQIESLIFNLHGFLFNHSCYSSNKGFWKALEDVRAEQTFVIAPVSEAYPIKENVMVCGIVDFMEKLQMG